MKQPTKAKKAEPNPRRPAHQPGREQRAIVDAAEQAKPVAKKADEREPRPMPKDFHIKFALEGSRMVARKDGVEVAYTPTDDKKAADEAEAGAAQNMWDAMEQARIHALGTKAA